MNNVHLGRNEGENTCYSKKADELLCWFANNQMTTNPGQCHLVTGDEVNIYLQNYSTTIMKPSQSH